jgi:2-methylcitrate synthase
MGFGHRVYKNGDPRSPVVKKLAAVLATKSKDPKLYDIAERIEHVMQNEKGIYPNLDFYSAVVYHFSGIPVEMFTPIFVIARTPGWIAHVIEQKKNNRLIRPIAHYNGPSERPFVKIHHR